MSAKVRDGENGGIVGVDDEEHAKGKSEAWSEHTTWFGTPQVALGVVYSASRESHERAIWQAIGAQEATCREHPRAVPRRAAA
jgi:hypothetical protein